MTSSIDFNAGYLRPGVYVSTQSTGAVATVGLGSTAICLVGAGVGYETNVEDLTFATTTSSVDLAKAGIVDDASLVVSAVLDSGPHTFVKDTDYTVVQASGVTTITGIASGTPLPTDRPVRVSYHYADDDYYALQRFTDEVSLQRMYGAALDPVDGHVQSPLTFAAQQAFRNGARVVFTATLDNRPVGGTVPGTAEQFKAAYQKMLPNYEIDLVVPLFSDANDTASATTYLTDLASFLTSAYNSGFPMMGIGSVDAAYATTDADALAAAVANKRVVLSWPQALNYFNAVNRDTEEADGVYVAAAAAGALAGQEVARGLTNTQLVGFTGIPSRLLNVMTTAQKDTWSSKGVSVIEANRSGQLVYRDGVTTDVTDIGTREISLVRAQDTLLEMLQTTLEEADLIGDPITVNTPMIIESLVTSALESALSSNLISDYSTPVVLQEQGPQGNPTVVDVTFGYSPTWPLKYITVNFMLNLSTNTITNINASTDTGDISNQSITG